MNRIKVGLQNYQWKVYLFSWLNYTECVIFNAIDPVQQLVIRIPGIKEAICTPRAIRLWIDEALRLGWYQQHILLELNDNNLLIRSKQISQSIVQETNLCTLLAKRETSQLSSLDKSNICYQFELLEGQLSFTLPTLFKQLYLHLGNGDFGPDYGFFHLFPDVRTSKITILDAYEKLNHALIKDWDWNLESTMLPFLYWGADIYSVLDCSSHSKGVFVLDMNLKKEKNRWNDCFWKHCDSFFEWCSKWQKDDLTGRSLWLEMYKLKGLI